MVCCFTIVICLRNVNKLVFLLHNHLYSKWIANLMEPPLPGTRIDCIYKSGGGAYYTKALKGSLHYFSVSLTHT